MQSTEYKRVSKDVQEQPDLAVRQTVANRIEHLAYAGFTQTLPGGSTPRCPPDTARKSRLHSPARKWILSMGTGLSLLSEGCSAELLERAARVPASHSDSP